MKNWEFQGEWKNKFNLFLNSQQHKWIQKKFWKKEFVNFSINLQKFKNFFYLTMTSADKTNNKENETITKRTNDCFSIYF